MWLCINPSLTRIDYVFLKIHILVKPIGYKSHWIFFIEMSYSVEDVTKPITRQHNAYKSVIDEYYDAYCGSGIGVVEMIMIEDGL